MSSLRNDIFGSVEIRFPRVKQLRITNLLLKNHVEFFGYSVAEWECRLSVPYSEYKRVSVLLERESVHFSKPRGLWFSVRRRMRPGIAVGFLLAFFLLFFARMFVWDVRVADGCGMDDDIVIETLRENGFAVGSFLPRTDVDAVENAVMTVSDEIGWISINMHGMIAVVEVIPSREIPEAAGKETPQNLVAAWDALLTEIAVENGRTVVKWGQVVKKGELLVSGVVTGANETRFVAATGKVYGRVERDFTVEIPLTVTQKSAMQQKNQKITINFFGYDINIYRNTGNLPSKYDTIYKTEQIALPGGLSLPIFVKREVAVTYEETALALSESEAIRFAAEEMRAMLASALADSDLISKKTSGHFEDDRYILTVHAVIVTDIAEASPITVED